MAWRPPRTIFLRVTGLSAAMSLAATMMLFVATRHVVIAQSQANLQRMVDADLAGLVDIYASGGHDELRRRIEDRLALSPQGALQGEDQAHYLLADATLRPMAGDLPRWPGLSAAQSASGLIDLGHGKAAFARATLLEHGQHLLVAREFGQREALLAKLGWAFAGVGALVMVLTVGAGLMAARRLRERVRRANADMARGQLLEPDGDADELELLSRHVQRIMARQASLIEAHRAISDQTAHELRTPLMHLDMQLLQALDRALDPALLDLLAKARGQIRRIIKMLESLLDIAANEARQGERSDLEEIDLSQIAEEILEVFADSAAERGLTLHSQLAAGVMMQGDPMQMSRLLANLLDNAFKYVPEGGEVRLEVAPGPFICVADNGPGIAPERREAIFERFVRAGHQAGGRTGGRAGGQVVEGHGLGLALVRSITQRHGLTIRYEDAKPGAMFVIERPVIERASLERIGSDQA